MWLYILWVSHLPPCRYNLRKAHDSLKQNWGEYMNETTFNWRMIKQVITQCHVYDEVRKEGGRSEVVVQGPGYPLWFGAAGTAVSLSVRYWQGLVRSVPQFCTALLAAQQLHRLHMHAVLLCAALRNGQCICCSSARPTHIWC